MVISNTSPCLDLLLIACNDSGPENACAIIPVAPAEKQLQQQAVGIRDICNFKVTNNFAKLEI